VAQSKIDQELVLHLTELFKFSFGKVQEPWKAAQRYQDKYDRIIDYEEWPTMSEMMIPFSMMAVDQSMAFLFDYVFPRNAHWLNFRPREEALPFASVELVRDYVEDVFKHKMRLKKHGYLTIKDSVKIGVGYGVVEPKQIRPERSVLKVVELFGRRVAQEHVVEEGAPETVESYRYLPFFSVIPMPDGSDPDEVSGVFHLDFKYEDELMQMYEYDSSLPTSRRTLKGDPVEIIKNTIDRKMNGNARPTLEIISQLAGLGGVDRLKTGQDASNLVNNLGGSRDQKLANAVVSVPILKCYFRGQHVWLANGDTVIQNIKDPLVTRKNPIVSCQSNPDSGRWFTAGIIAASEDPDHTTNVYYNALMDILQEHLHPTRIADKRALPDGVMPQRKPFQDVEVYGSPKDAIQYVQPPPLSPGILSIGEVLQNFGAAAKGQPLALQGQATPGMLRGGVGAFESMLQGSFGRQKMVGALIETGWFESTAVRTLSLAQAVITAGGRKFISEREGRDGRPEFYEQRVTPDDIRHAYDVSIDLEEKFQNAIADENMKMQKFSILKDDPYIDPYESRLDFIGNNERGKRWLGSRQKAEQTRQAIIQGSIDKLAQIQAQQIAAEQGQPGAEGGGLQPGATRTEQALAGGAAQAEGLAG
jgi:hypothetical protein